MIGRELKLISGNANRHWRRRSLMRWGSACAIPRSSGSTTVRSGCGFERRSGERMSL